MTCISHALREPTTLSTLLSMLVSALSQNSATTQPWTGANCKQGVCWPCWLIVALQPQFSAQWLEQAIGSNIASRGLRTKPQAELGTTAFLSCVQPYQREKSSCYRLILGSVSSRKNWCQAFHYGTLKYFRKKKRKISTNLLHATPALHQLSLGAESDLQLTWPSTA